MNVYFYTKLSMFKESRVALMSLLDWSSLLDAALNEYHPDSTFSTIFFNFSHKFVIYAYVEK